jgi:hypothetical protein
MSTDRYRAGKRLWSQADDQLLRRRYPFEPTHALARELRRSVIAVSHRALAKLGLRKSEAYLASPAACRLRRGDNVGAATRYPKGHIPANKGLRRPGYSIGRGRMQQTQFKKGHLGGRAAEVIKPIGFERISKDGYLERKISNAMPFQRRWRAVHLLIWEAANGPLPKGHAIRFRNGDKTDRRLENLTLVTRGALMKRNSIHAVLPPTLKKAVYGLIHLKRQISRQERIRAQKQD